jgi:hypothetical protein
VSLEAEAAAAAREAVADLIELRREHRRHPSWQEVPALEMHLFETLDGVAALLEGSDGLPGRAARTLVSNLIAANCPNAYRLLCLDLQAACVRGPTSGRD